MKGRNSRECGGVGGLGEIFVAIEANRNSDFRFTMGRNRVEFGGRPDHAQNASSAANGHALAQRDLGGHSESDFDFRAFGERRVGEEEDSARTEVLGESDAFEGGCGLAERERKKIGKPLSDTAFNLNWRSGHSGVTSSAESPALL
jgi:hypothetical protein